MCGRVWRGWGECGGYSVSGEWGVGSGRGKREWGVWVGVACEWAMEEDSTGGESGRKSRG